MRTFNWKSATLCTAMSMAIAVAIQACGDDNAAIAQSTTPVVATPDPIEGLWQSAVTIRDCTGGATVTTFRGLTDFHRGGTATADNNQPSTTKGVAMGVWSKGATGLYTFNARFWRYLVDATPAGSQRFTRVITLSADGLTLTSTISAQIFDNNDNVVQTICGVETGTKVG